MQAALLHDVTHGPFSHAFEGLFEKNKIPHECWTKHFVREILSEEENEEDRQDVISLITKKEKNRESKLPPFLFDIISSQLDADRLDYLLRDAHFSGVCYGLYNPDWLIHCLDIIFKKDNEIDEKESRLGITRKGVGVVEHYLNARRLMTFQVYLHKTKCAAEFLFAKMLRLASKEIVTLKGKALEKLSLNKHLLNFLENVNSFEKTELKEGELGKFVCENFQSYRNLTDDILWDFMKRISLSKEKSIKEIKEIACKLIERKLPKVFTVPSSDYDAVKIEVVRYKEGKLINGWKLWLEKPSKFIAYESDDKKIFVTESSQSVDDKGNNLATDISHHSKIINSVTNLSEISGYLYCDEGIFGEVEKELVKPLREKGFSIY